MLEKITATEEEQFVSNLEATQTPSNADIITVKTVDF